MVTLQSYRPGKSPTDLFSAPLWEIIQAEHVQVEVLGLEV